jgi:hypothetical protein
MLDKILKSHKKCIPLPQTEEKSRNQEVSWTLSCHTVTLLTSMIRTKNYLPQSISSFPVGQSVWKLQCTFPGLHSPVEHWKWSWLSQGSEKTREMGVNKTYYCWRFCGQGEQISTDGPCLKSSPNRPGRRIWTPRLNCGDRTLGLYSPNAVVERQDSWRSKSLANRGGSKGSVIYGALTLTPQVKVPLFEWGFTFGNALFQQVAIVKIFDWPNCYFWTPCYAFLHVLKRDTWIKHEKTIKKKNVFLVSSVPADSVLVPARHAKMPWLGLLTVLA